MRAGQAMSEALLTVRGVETFYGKIQALRGVDIDVAKGEIVALIGSNGAGKSTLMMTICGTPRARAGNIAFDDHDITRMPTHEIIRLGIAQSPEGRRIFPRMTVLENLQMGAAVSDPATFRRRCRSVSSSMFPILAKRQSQRGGTLVGRRAADARHCPRADGAARACCFSTSRRSASRPLHRQADLRGDPRAQRHAGPHRLPGRAERLSRAQARPSRLCHGQRPDHHDAAPARSFLPRRKSAPPISKAAIEAKSMSLFVEDKFIDFSDHDRDHRRRRGLSCRPRACRQMAADVDARRLHASPRRRLRFFHYALFDGELLSAALFHHRHGRF